MNETLNNEISSEPLVHLLCLDDERTPSINRRRSRKGTTSLRLYRTLGLAVALGIAILGCGSSGAGQGGSHQGSPLGIKPTEAEVVAHSTTNCVGKPLVQTWRVAPTWVDTIVIKDNCLFESFYCGSLGYIDSDITAEVGITKIIIVYQGASNPGCLGVGSFTCSYDARNKFYKELTYSCQ